jgi:hypothetical protein
MDALDQARLIVADRVIPHQNRSIAAMQIRSEIASKRAAIATMLQSPWFYVMAPGAIYLVICFIMDYFVVKKEEK